jgi:hypothetical protein
MVSKIQTTLREATGLKPKSGEDTQEFWKRLIAAVQELPEDAWEKLDTKAQKWVNDGAKAINAKEDIADFPDAEAANEEDDEVATKTKTAKKGGEKTGKAPTKKVAADDKPEKKATKKEAKPEKEVKKPAATKRGSGLESTIKNMIVKKPTITSDELVEKLEAKQVKASRFTVVAIRAGFRHSIKVLQEAGLIKGQMEL